jgi:hypothetical protein
MLAAAVFGLFVSGLDPPARYQHEPPGGVQIVIVPDDKMIRGAGAYTYGHPGRKCVIYIAQRYVGSWLFEHYRGHEIAHCNGWPANHPQ